MMKRNDQEKLQFMSASVVSILHRKPHVKLLFFINSLSQFYGFVLDGLFVTTSCAINYAVSNWSKL